MFIMIKTNFYDFVEKLNEKTIMWNKNWLSIENGKLMLYEKKPSNLH